jgi:hypothetical protein
MKTTRIDRPSDGEHRKLTRVGARYICMWRMVSSHMSELKKFAHNRSVCSELRLDFESVQRLQDELLLSAPPKVEHVEGDILLVLRHFTD